MAELLPFAKEMFNQRPSRHMLKIYLIGTTVAVLGVIGGLVESICAQFTQAGLADDIPAELCLEKKQKKIEMEEKSVTALKTVDVADVEDTVLDKATHLRRSSANRLHAS